ncbi:retrovirus-related pol polyprotein from transposon TNT 1-94 [Tanacetum coccineum]
MAIAKDEPSIGKANARSGQWVEITMKKVHRLLSMTVGDERKHVLDYTHVDLHYVKDQRKNLVNKFNLLKQELSLHKGRRKYKISSKEVTFTKADESSSMSIPEITSKSECETQEPLPPLLKLVGVKPVGTSNSLISLADLTLNMADLTLNISVPKNTKPTSDKVSPTHAIKKNTETKSSTIPVLISEKKGEASAENLLLTLIEEVKSLKEHIKFPLDNSPSVSQTRSSKSSEGLPKEESGPKVVFEDNSSGDTEGYGSVNCNGITFTRVAYSNGLKHNLISISQLCDANFKVLFTKTFGTIFNQNDEVLLIAPRRRDVYVIDIKMENLNEVMVKELRSDNGTKFRNHKLEEFYDEKGISQNFASPCTPKQNGVAKRRNKTLIEAAGTMDHLGKFDEKVDDGFSLSSGQSFQGDAINFNKNRSFPDDEFLEPKNNVTQFYGNIKYFPYIPAYEIITKKNSTPTNLIPQDSVSPEEPPEFTNVDDHPALSELDHLKLADNLEPAKIQDFAINEPISEVQPSPKTISPLADVSLQPPVPQDKLSREMHI